MHDLATTPFSKRRRWSSAALESPSMISSSHGGFQPLPLLSALGFIHQRHSDIVEEEMIGRKLTGLSGIFILGKVFLLQSKQLITELHYEDSN